MNVKVRAAPADDYRGLCDVYTCPGVMRNTAGLPYVSLDYWRERTETSRPGRHVLVAEADGRVTASINLHCGRGLTSHTASFGMGVHDDFVGEEPGRAGHCGASGPGQSR